MIIGIIVTLILSAGLVVLVTYRIHQGMQPPPSPRSASPPTHLPLRPVEMNGESGKLCGWFIPGRANASSEKRPAILLTHGWGRNAEQMLPYAEFLHDQILGTPLADCAHRSKSH
jgi:hypothetical protein